MAIITVFSIFQLCFPAQKFRPNTLFHIACKSVSLQLLVHSLCNSQRSCISRSSSTYSNGNFRSLPSKKLFAIYKLLQTPNLRNLSCYFVICNSNSLNTCRIFCSSKPTSQICNVTCSCWDNCWLHFSMLNCWNISVAKMSFTIPTRWAHAEFHAHQNLLLRFAKSLVVAEIFANYTFAH